MNNFGMNVEIRHKTFGKFMLYNVTEIHYRFKTIFEVKRCAFESDIHCTGIVYDVDDIIEFETSTANKVHKGLSE